MKNTEQDLQNFVKILVKHFKNKEFTVKQAEEKILQANYSYDMFSYYWQKAYIPAKKNTYIYMTKNHNFKLSHKALSLKTNNLQNLFKSLLELIKIIKP